MGSHLHVQYEYASGVPVESGKDAFAVNRSFGRGLTFIADPVVVLVGWHALRYSEGRATQRGLPNYVNPPKRAPELLTSPQRE